MPELTRVERAGRRAWGETLFRVAKLLGWSGPALVVVPDRPRLFSHFARLAARSGLPVAVTTFDRWAVHILRSSGVAALPSDPARERVIAEEVAASARPQLKRFLKLAGGRGFAENLRRTRSEIGSIELDAQASDALADVALLMRRWSEHPESRSRLDRPALLRQAAGLVASADRPALWLAGFDRLDAAEAELLRAAWPTFDQVAVELDSLGGLSLDWAGPSRLVQWEASAEGPPALLALEATPGQHVPSGEGIDLIEAPGPVGEARMVARRLKELLRAGVRPSELGIVRRDWHRDFDAWALAFADHNLDLVAPEATSLARVPGVAHFLAALRTPDNDFPFESITPLLRAGWFRPTWAAPEMPGKAEALLRMLGESRGRAAVILACRVWADEPPEALEDEQAEEGLRRRKTRLAKECGSFFERFFGQWDGLNGSKPVGEFLDWLTRFADSSGWRAWMALDEAGASALSTWDAALAGMRRSAGPAPVSSEKFLRDLAGLIQATPAPVSPPNRPLIAIDEPEAWAGLRVRHLVITGLNEGVFPRPSSPGGLLDDADRELLRGRGADLPSAEQRADSEAVLFRRLMDVPAEGLTLSRVGFDGRGQPTLPAAAWRDLVGRFEPGAIATTSRRMPLEGYWTDAPASASQARHIEALKLLGISPRSLDPRSRSHRLRVMALRRASATAFTDHDGWLGDAELGDTISRRFGPDKVMSPTALERYVACPFQFLVRDVWLMSPLDRPSAGVEPSRRGSAFHRALARFHEALRADAATHTALREGADAVRAEVTAQIHRALEEYRKRATTASARKLWELEGRRLERHARRYVDHWLDFLGTGDGPGPVPTFLEADFGLPGPTRPGGPPDPPMRPALVLESADGTVAVRLGGRIDRVDVAMTPAGPRFWVIDYKTGRAANYSAADLLRHEKLQLPLYALAVQRLFFEGGGDPHPQGMAYWLVTDGGVKGMMPGKKQADWEQAGAGWDKFSRELTAKVLGIAASIRAGHFPLRPNGEKACEHCEAARVCRIGGARSAVAGRELFSIEVVGR